MGTKSGQHKKRCIFKMLFFGGLTVGLYAALFMNHSTIMLYFTKGNLFAALPVVTALIFSYAHGGFTNYFWQVLGIEASKKKLQQRPEQKQPVVRERIRPQPRLRA